MNTPLKFVLSLLVFLLITVACVPSANQLPPDVQESTTTPTRNFPLATATLLTATLTSVPTHPPLQPTATIANESILHTVINDTGSISVTIPSTWTDVRSLPWVDEHQVVIGHKLVASTDVDAFLQWKADGVAISVSRNLGIGYAQLLDINATRYGKLAPHPIYGYDDFTNNLYRGKYFSLWLCGGVQGCLLKVFSLVPRGGSSAYVAEVLLYDDLPYSTQAIYDKIMQFEVNPDRLP